MSNIRTLINKKNALARSIRAIQEDYSGVLPEDMPDEVVEELRQMRLEMAALREQVTVKETKNRGFDFDKDEDELVAVDEVLHEDD